MNKPMSVSAVCNFPEKPWLLSWATALMRGDYPDWAPGTEPAEVRTEAQQIGTVFHLLVQKRLGRTPTPRLLSAANKAMLDEQILARAYKSFDLWNTWVTSLKDMKIEHVEFDLSDTELGVSARCDAILLIAGKRTVCEWKTGADLHEGDALEACAYAWLANRKLKAKIDRALLVHVPCNGNAMRVVALETSTIVHGAVGFSALLQAKQAWEVWKTLCRTGLKIGGA